MKGKRIGKRLRELRTYIAMILTGVSIWFEVQLILFGMLGTGWLLLVAGGLFLIDWLILALLFGRKKKQGRRLLGKILGVLISVILALGSAGLQLADSIFNAVTSVSEVRRDLSLVVLKDSGLQSVQDITADTILGFEMSMAEEGTEKMLGKVEKKARSDPKKKEFDNLNAEISGLYQKEAEVIVLNESFRNTVLDEYEHFNEETRVIYSISYQEPQKNISRKIDVSSKPFLVLVTGMDSYGAIDTVSRSDVNILAAVDPAAGNILLVSIPRDYYVPIITGTQDGTAGAKKEMDKLTHSGLFGAECTVRTLENLFDTEINYYVKVNFSGVVDIIDALGGITVQSDYAFGNFQKGKNELNGEQVLEFARNRHAFEDGDRQRGKNQMKIMEGILNKVSGFSLDYDYAALFRAVSGSLEMNFSDQEIKQLIQMEITSHPSWNVETISVTGTDGNDVSYFYGSNLYVMYPEKASVNTAKEKIRAILGREKE